MKPTPSFLSRGIFPSLISIAFSLPLLAVDIVKSDAGNDLNDGASWGGDAPASTDTAVWSGTSLGSGLSLGADASWGGIRVEGAASPIDISGAGVLTLGQAGMDTTSSNVNVSIANNIALAGSSWWTADTGNTITASGVISGNATLNLGARGVSLNTYLPGTPTTTTITGLSLANVSGITGLMGGAFVNGGNGNYLGSAAYDYSNSGTTATYQLRILDGGFTKSVGVTLTESGSDLLATVHFAKFINGSNLANDFDVVGTTGTIATSNGGNGYGAARTSLAFTPTADQLGTIILSGNNTFTGGVAVHAGTVRIGNVNAFGQNATRTHVGTVVVNAGASVDFNGVNDAIYGYTIAGTGAGGVGALTNSAGGIGNNFRQASNIALSADASIGGSGNWSLLTSSFNATSLFLNGFTLTKTGTNTIGLVNTSLNAGTVQVAQGTLALGPAGSGVNGSAAAFVMDNASGANLSVNLNSSLGSLAGGGTTGGNVSIAGTRILTVGALATDTVYSGVISGAGSLVKTGNGSLTLTRVNTLAGGISVHGGTVVFNASGPAFDSATGSGGGTLVVDAGGTARFASNFNAGFSRPVNVNGGTLEFTSGVAADSSNYSNAITLNSGASVTGNRLRAGFHSDATINVGGSSASTLSSGIALVNNASLSETLTLNVGDASGDAAVDLTVSGVMSDLPGFGGLPLIKDGIGTARFTAANTYTGTTTIQNGTLLANNTSGSATGSGAITVKDTAVLGGNGSVAGSVTVESGGAIAPGDQGVEDLALGSALMIQPGGKLVIEVNGATTSDKVMVTGELSVLGIIEISTVGHTFAAGNSYDIADAATISGTPVISPATPGAGLAWDTSALNTGGVISVIEAGGYDAWAGPSGYNLSGNDALRASDPDKDGFTNLQEYLFGSSPLASNAALISTETSGGNLILRWLERESGASYALRQSTTLQTNSWVDVPPPAPALADQSGVPVGYDRYEATLSIGAGTRFFRVEGTEN